MGFLDWFRQPKRPENTGVIVDNRPTDYMVGSSPIVFQTRLQDGNWTNYCWSKNKQWNIKGGVYYDKYDCVTESMLTAIETQEFFLTGKQVKYSRRWIAKMSGTTKQGNYLYKVADTIRSLGLVLDSSLPDPASYTFDEYYAEVDSPQLRAEGQAWLNKWSFQYEFLQITDPNIDYHLKHSPLQLVVPGHAVCGIYSPDQYVRYRDSYDPFDKSTAESDLQQVMKPILTPKGVLARKVGWQGSPELGIYIPADNMERFDFIKQNIGNWIPGYSLDDKVYTIPTKKPF